MASPVTLPAAFDGMVQDFPRDQMPKNRAWNIVDAIPASLGAPWVERGGWTYASGDLSATAASATYIPAVVYANFAAAAKLVAITDNNHLVTVASTSSATDVSSSAVVPLQLPVLHAEKLIIPASDGTTAPKYYDGASTVGNLAGSPPAAKYAAVWVNRTWLANTNSHPTYVYASDAGDPTSWDTTNTFIPVSAPVTGLAALPNVLLVFTGTKTVRFRGSTPPPQSDMIIDDPIFNVGCTDARSIAVNGAVCCFANPQGVYLSNGTATPEDLTESVGLKKYWTDLLSGYTSSWTLAGGWIRNQYLITVMNGATFKDAFLIDVRKRTAVRVSNVKGVSFAGAVTVGEKLYVGSRAAPRVLEMSSIFSPASAVKNDGDGTAVAGVWETPFFEPAQLGGQRWRDVYLEYDLRDAASDDPTMTVGYITSPEASSYTSLSPTFAETSRKTTARVPVRVGNRGLAFKVSRTNAAQDARIYKLAATVYGREPSRLNLA